MRYVVTIRRRIRGPDGAIESTTAVIVNARSKLAALSRAEATMAGWEALVVQPVEDAGEGN